MPSVFDRHASPSSRIRHARAFAFVPVAVAYFPSRAQSRIVRSGLTCLGRVAVPSSWVKVRGPAILSAPVASWDLAVGAGRAPGSDVGETSPDTGIANEEGNRSACEYRAQTVPGCGGFTSRTLNTSTCRRSTRRDNNQRNVVGNSETWVLVRARSSLRIPEKRSYMERVGATAGQSVRRNALRGGAGRGFTSHTANAAKRPELPLGVHEHNVRAPSELLAGGRGVAAAHCQPAELQPDQRGDDEDAEPQLSGGELDVPGALGDLLPPFDRRGRRHLGPGGRGLPTGYHSRRRFADAGNGLRRSPHRAGLPHCRPVECDDGKQDRPGLCGYTSRRGARD